MIQKIFDLNDRSIQMQHEMLIHLELKGQQLKIFFARGEECQKVHQVCHANITVEDCLTVNILVKLAIITL